MENMDWVFEGIGTEIIASFMGLLIGGFGGGVVGYKIGSKSKAKQQQKANDNAKQIQYGNITILNGNEGEK